MFTFKQASPFTFLIAYVSPYQNSDAASYAIPIHSHSLVVYLGSPLPTSKITGSSEPRPSNLDIACRKFFAKGNKILRSVLFAGHYGNFAL